MSFSKTDWSDDKVSLLFLSIGEIEASIERTFCLFMEKIVYLIYLSDCKA